MGVARPGPQHTKAVWQKDVRHWATLPRCLLRQNGPDVTRPTLQSQWKTGGRPSGTSSPPPPTDPNYHSCISSPLFLHFPSIILFTRTLLEPLCPGWGWDKGPIPMPKTLLFDPELVSSEFRIYLSLQRGNWINRVLNVRGWVPLRSTWTQATAAPLQPPAALPPPPLQRFAPLHLLKLEYFLPRAFHEGEGTKKTSFCPGGEVARGVRVCPSSCRCMSQGSQGLEYKVVPPAAGRAL